MANLSNNTGDNFDPSFSPNGSLIAYVSNVAGNPDLYRMNADGTAQTRLVAIDGAAANPHFSEDGQWIIFEVQKDGAGEIHIVNIDGSGHTNLTNNTADDGQPTW
jgi:TolB protein